LKKLLMMMKFTTFTSNLFVFASLLGAPTALAQTSQDGTWLDDNTNWNEAAMAIPQAPVQDGNMFEGCEHVIRPAALPEDERVQAAGWTLTNSARVFGDTTVITAMASAGGQCRPFDYQVFVFTDGEFSGTLSPVMMDARTDGSLVDFSLYREGFMDATFNRYKPDDAQCCASSESRLFYEVDTSTTPPVLVPQLPANTYPQPEYK
jgi:hypothetical protein